MPEKDKRIDAYIERSADFAKPVLNHLRKIVHKACPNVEETWKWSFPHFDYRGEMMCSMAAFKEHCAFGFWKASLMESKKEFTGNNKDAMGHMGKIRSVSDLPSEKEIIRFIKEAMKLNDDGIKLTKKPVKAVKEVKVPEDLSCELYKNKKAMKVFEGFSPSHRKEYIEWINEAKTESTRAKRILNAVDMIEEGKSRHWNYK